MEHQTNFTPKRSIFLTVLCVLTFIGSSLFIIKGLGDLLFSGVSSQFFQVINEKSKKALTPPLEDVFVDSSLSESTDYMDIDSLEIVEDEFSEELDSIIEEIEPGFNQNTYNPARDFAQSIIDNLVADLTLENIKNNAYASILASILTLLGAIMMWKLRKIGFWVYVLGTVIGIVAPLLIFPGNIIAVVFSVALSLIGIIFIVLYAINKKQLVC